MHVRFTLRPEPRHDVHDGGFVCMRHDEVRDVTAEMLSEVSRDIRVEPPLIPTGGRNFSLQSTNPPTTLTWTSVQADFGHGGSEPSLIYASPTPWPQATARKQKHENDKIREYGERVREIEQGTFTPLVFTTSGGIAPRAVTFYSCLGQKLSEKRQPKSCVMAWIPCRLAFSLRSSLLCLKGTRNKPIKYTSIKDLDIEQTVVNSRLERNM
ncbi:uncharacterized protein LOC119577475 [Penaeus monodon]|uniref:uncharacterized protein LOC119577475 n=1 Tax=Penaeus monodon TaxID=6687 RepID=UPI0018A70A0F|nr:uncharacterized protein LOC119577475 [Penaeus monodon]